MGQLRYEYDQRIANEIKEGIRKGLAMKVIFDAIQRHQQAPKAYSTFLKMYGQDIANARADFQGELGELAMARIREGSDKILELALRSKAGWNPRETIEIEAHDESTNEMTSLIEELALKLGKTPKKEDEE